MKKIGFFGGTFDPIHFGHLNLAVALFEKHRLDEVIFSPASFSPEKVEAKPVVSGKDRLKMVELAIEEISPFSATCGELQRSGPSYTVDTIRSLKQQKGDAQFFLILGADLLEGLENWKEVEELLRLAPPLVGTRSLGSMPKLSSRFKEIILEGMTEIPTMEISSTALRKRLSEERICTHLVPSKVLDYIRDNRLY